MRKKLFLCLFVFAFSLNANELDWVDHQIKAIKPPRTGITSSNINTLSDPFIFLEKKEDAEIKNVLVPASNIFAYPNEIEATPPIRLFAILNNSALINAKWCKVGDIIDGYKVLKIDVNSVHLSSNGQQLLLTTQSSSKNLKFKNK